MRAADDSLPETIELYESQNLKKPSINETHYVVPLFNTEFITAYLEKCNELLFKLDACAEMYNYIQLKCGCAMS